jgi:hypothetical protein
MMPEQTEFEQQADAYVEAINWWEEVDIQGEDKRGVVNITGRTVVPKDSGGFHLLVKADDNRVFICIASMEGSARENILGEGHLILEDKIYMSLPEAFKPGNESAWLGFDQVF